MFYWRVIPINFKNIHRDYLLVTGVQLQHCQRNNPEEDGYIDYMDYLEPQTNYWKNKARQHQEYILQDVLRKN